MPSLDCSDGEGNLESGTTNAGLSMNILFDSPQNYIGLALCLIGAVVSYVRGTRSFIWGIRNPDHPQQSLKVVRGIRGWIVGAALLFAAGGIWYEVTWPLWFALVFVGVELLETGIMIFALKRGERESAGSGEKTD